MMRTPDQWHVDAVASHDEVNRLIAEARSAAAHFRLLAFSRDRQAKARAQEKADGLMRELRQAVARQERLFAEEVQDNSPSSSTAAAPSTAAASARRRA